MRTLLTFAANETSKTVSVPMTDDSADEEDETFTLTLSSPANAMLGGAAATGTIEDDDDAPPPLPASFEGMPGAHDGESAFTFRLRFSEDPDVGYRMLRDEAFEVSGGAVVKAIWRRIFGHRSVPFGGVHIRHRGPWRGLGQCTPLDGWTSFARPVVFGRFNEVRRVSRPGDSRGFGRASMRPGRARPGGAGSCSISPCSLLSPPCADLRNPTARQHHEPRLRRQRGGRIRLGQRLGRDLAQDGHGAIGVAIQRGRPACAPTPIS